jgi:DNA-directed RNA polymerase subunit RPC12/RpoP
MSENKCNSCGEEFDLPKEVAADDGSEYVCPFCGSLEWDTNNDE